MARGRPTRWVTPEAIAASIASADQAGLSRSSQAASTRGFCSRTQPWQRTEVKDRFSQLREALDPDDRILLTLRIDRDLAWDEVARVMLDGEAADAGTLQRETDRLRKRFQLLKTELRKRAQAAGLLDVAQ